MEQSHNQTRRTTETNKQQTQQQQQHNATMQAAKQRFQAPSPLMSSPPFPVLPNAPQLLIARQNSLAVEKISKNGILKRVHVVVKNQPFLMQVSLSSNIIDGQAIDLHKASVEARLLYDCDPLKEVDFVKHKPLEFKCHTNEFERNDQLTVELRLKVLSSQLEDMFFRIRLTLIHPITKQRIPAVTAVSDPIKVVSKPDQVKKKKEGKKATAQPAAPKKTIEEVLAEALIRVERTVNQQKEILTKLMASSTATATVSSLTATTTSPNNHINSNNNNNNMMNAATTMIPSAANAAALYMDFDIIPPSFQLETDAGDFENWESIRDYDAALAAKKKKEEEELSQKSPEANAFETAFKRLLRAYERLDDSDKPTKMRRVIREIGQREVPNAEEMFSIAGAENANPSHHNNNNNNNNNHVPGGPCLCVDCPYKIEVAKMDEFYTEMLSNPALLG